MCRLFGFKSAVPSRPHRSLLAAENALAAQAADHPDGWGIGWFAEDDAYVVKSASPAHACERFRQVANRLQSHTFVAHVRRATVGGVDVNNAHPFRHGRWLFAHNGTVFGLAELREWIDARTRPDLALQIVGDTDSERLFFYLLTSMASAGVDPTGRTPAEALAVGGALRQALLTLDREAARRGVRRPILNVLLTDGRVFVAQRAGHPLWMSTQKKSCPDAGTCPMMPKVCLEPERVGDRVNHLLVASEPIGDENVWEGIPDGSTVVLDDHFTLSLLPPIPGWAAAA
jgi:predicted glutamine amidotransferase